MRAIRQSGSEGGGVQTLSLPYRSKWTALLKNDRCNRSAVSKHVGFVHPELAHRGSLAGKLRLGAAQDQDLAIEPKAHNVERNVMPEYHEVARPGSGHRLPVG